uniref:(northern house mosquito) hypothetical protein n=1 Tax=Culex pipiens TaxID=7175 RepID=A0A8D8CJC1_CULPI
MRLSCRCRTRKSLMKLRKTPAGPSNASFGWSRHSVIRWNQPRFRINKKVPRGPPSPQKAVVANNPNLTRRTILRAETTGREVSTRKKKIPFLTSKVDRK